eukprot:284130_1
MANNSFISDFAFIPVTISDGMGRSCIASSSIYNTIYINGGISHSNIAMNETYVLHIDTMKWSLTSPMQTARRSHSCICANHNLYSIGGNSINGITATIETISMINIEEKQWIYLTSALSVPLTGSRSFLYDNNIIVIGGINSGKLYDTVHIIDTITDIVIVSDIKLAFATAYTAAIMVRDIMYAFGGGFGNDNWQSQTVLTQVTTTSFNSFIPNTTLPYLDDSSTIYTTDLGESDELVFGNKIGIGVAVALFGCLVVVVVVFFVHMHRHMKE